MRRGATSRVRHLLEKTRSEDIAYVFPALLQRERHRIFELLGSFERQAEVLSELDESLLPELLEPLGIEAVVEILHEVSADDVADIFAVLGEERATAILERM